MNDIKFILPAMEEILQLSNGCCCQIDVPEHGFVGGPKLVVTDPPPA